ncbi:membralin [Caerostris extrusa]|uniref:Membralin n=1 Tax=Caerostris extrusa TaxID=172846 RepID=A0AAV4MM61_CAEEX|nr:membralin [Caerostris extrusa]
MPRHLFQVTVNFPASLRNHVNNNQAFNPYVFVRNRLYHFLFHRFAIVYARLFSNIHRKIIEFFLLLIALLSFILLIYVHVVFVQKPVTCLKEYKGVWQRNGILRVEILSGKGKENYTLDDSYWKEKTLRLSQLGGHYFYSDSEIAAEEEEEEEEEEVIEEVYRNESIKGEDSLDAFNDFDTGDLKESNSSEDKENKILVEETFQPLSEHSILASDLDNAYILEFALDYGFLRLQPAKRKELNISVTFVILDPAEETCFGGSFNKFLLDNLLGYDNVLLASIRNVVDKKDQKGYVRNAVMEIEYIFLNNWINDKSYLMALFTLAISALLRHSHHQIFIVVANFFDVLWPRNIFPTSGAPVLSIVLALVGMEAVMSDFFHDRSIALNVIIIIWFADLYEAVCCQSAVSKKYFYRFFCLYHYMFYAYNYKFSGIYWHLSLTTSWLFTLHAMVFFFHHYELPRFINRIHHQITKIHLLTIKIHHQITKIHLPDSQDPSSNNQDPPPDSQDPSSNNNQDPPPDIQDPSSNNQDPPPDSQDPSSNNQDPPPDSQDPSSNNQDPPPDSQDPPSNNQDPPPDSQNPPPDSQDPPPDSQDPPSNNQDPPPDSQDPSSNNQDSPPDNQDPPPNSQDPSPNSQDPSPNSQDPPLDSQDPPPESVQLSNKLENVGENRPGNIFDQSDKDLVQFKADDYLVTEGVSTVSYKTLNSSKREYKNLTSKSYNDCHLFQIKSESDLDACSILQNSSVSTSMNKFRRKNEDVRNIINKLTCFNLFNKPQFEIKNLDLLKCVENHIVKKQKYSNKDMEAKVSQSDKRHFGEYRNAEKEKKKKIRI